jgi:hypothetical protein
MVTNVEEMKSTILLFLSIEVSIVRFKIEQEVAEMKVHPFKKRKKRKEKEKQIINLGCFRIKSL